MVESHNWAKPPWKYIYNWFVREYKNRVDTIPWSLVALTTLIDQIYRGVSIVIWSGSNCSNNPMRVNASSATLSRSNQCVGTSISYGTPASQSWVSLIQYPHGTQIIEFQVPITNYTYIYNTSTMFYCLNRMIVVLQPSLQGPS